MRGVICEDVCAGKLLQLNLDPTKGRYVTAKRNLKPGDVVISEDAFSTVLLQRKNCELSYCHYCLSVINTSVKCHGCIYEQYCSETCKRLAWKSHHWLECCLGSVLCKAKLETRMAVRVLLRAAHSMFSNGATGYSPLSAISDDMFANSTIKGGPEKDGCVLNPETGKKEYTGCYWSIYCLQTHQNEPENMRFGKEVMKDIKLLSCILLSCFAWYDTLIDACDVEKEKSSTSSKHENNGELDSLLHSVFRRLSFSSYYTIEGFDIETWRSYLMAVCKSAASKEGSESRSFEQVISQTPSTNQQVLERLLLHHTLQLRTNAQAVFKVTGAGSGVQGVEITEQKRIATAFFPATSLMNHSCSPNTLLSFKGRRITVVASKTIRKGDEVLHSYGPFHSRHSVEERQKILREQYFFHCDCTSCQADCEENEDLNSYKLQFQAFKCSRCNNPIKTESGDSKAGICINTDCGKNQDLANATSIYQNTQKMFSDACSMLENGQVKKAFNKFNVCLKDMQSVLYHNHKDIGKVHDQIAKCFVMQENYSSAVSHLCKSITIVGMMHGPSSMEMGQELQKLASVYFNIGDYANAAKNAKKVMSIYKTYFTDATAFPPGTADMQEIIKLSGTR